ncbi:MAG: type II secretion system protein [Verrucomicrobia bacterium]|nr:type II secretion system protein [Verrucomicrobiota bacterium]
MKTSRQSAFTLIEMLVVISIIAILAAFAVPALTSALTKGQLTGTMNNARQLYLAGYQMALDGSTNSDPTLSWPGDDATLTTMSAYMSRLVANNYLKPGDVSKLLSGPGASVTATAQTSGNQTTVTLAAVQPNTKGALKVYRVQDVDPANVIFCVSSNYDYNKTLPGSYASVPYGTKGFVVQRKGGDASVLHDNQATSANYTPGPQAWMTLVGLPTGSGNATQPPASEPSGSVLTFP